MAHAVIDEAYHCHLGFVVANAETGAPEPRVLPTLHVRIDDTLYVHGSTGSRPLLAARSDNGLPVCVTVTHLDGLVFGRSQFHHSANYRAAIAHGRARLVTDESEKRRVLTRARREGRARPIRRQPATDATGTRGDGRTRTSADRGVGQGPCRRRGGRARGLALPHWAGVVPLRLTPGLAEPDAGVTAPLPEYLRPTRSAWLTAVPMRGEHVILEPLDLSHVEELFAATADDEVYRWLTRPRPVTEAELAGQVQEALRAHQRGLRVPWVQRSALTG